MEDARDASATGMRVLFFEGNGDAGLCTPPFVRRRVEEKGARFAIEHVLIC